MDDISPTTGIVTPTKKPGMVGKIINSLGGQTSGTAPIRNGPGRPASSRDQGPMRPKAEEIYARLPGKDNTKKSGPPPLPSQDDLDREAERKDFEVLITELLVATTDDLADSRFQKLKPLVQPEKLARELADKARLTNTEKKHFSKIVVRLWEKYVDAGFSYSEEMMATVLVISYFLRNREASKIIHEHRVKSEPSPIPPPPITGGFAIGSNRSGLQGPAGVGPGHNGNGEEHTGISIHSSAPR